MNRIVLVGRLAQEPELRYTQTGIAVTKFAIAVNRPFLNQQGQREADFIDIVVWRNQAENCAQYLSKGRLVGIDGRLQIRSYETAEGQRRRVAEVVADRVEFLDWAKDTDQESGSSARQQTGDDSGFPDDVPF